MKQLDCEILIRKKEALPVPPSPPIAYIQSQPQPAVQTASTPSPMPAAAASPAPTPAASPPKAQPSKSSHRPIKCPMAGTFYRSPAPGEPPFVKVIDINVIRISNQDTPVSELMSFNVRAAFP